MTHPLKLTAYDLLRDDSDLPIRTVIGRVAAGTPLEIVGDEELIDFNYVLQRHSRNTMAVRVEGDSMCPEIKSGDWVVLALDREPKPGDIVIARLENGYTIKRLEIRDVRGETKLRLVASNGRFTSREITAKDDFQVLGVITGRIQSFI